VSISVAGWLLAFISRNQRKKEEREKEEHRERKTKGKKRAPCYNKSHLVTIRKKEHPELQIEYIYIYIYIVTKKEEVISINTRRR